MNPLAKLFFYAAAVLLLAALLSPPAYWMMHDLHPTLSDIPFRRFLSRTALIVALILLWPMLRWVKVYSFSTIGLERNPKGWRDFSIGFGLAFLPLLCLAFYYFGYDIYRLRKEIEWMKLLGMIGTAAAVPVVEEFLFRGILLGLAVRYFGRWIGIVSISLIFAVVHFIDSRFDVTDVRWWSGFEVLSHAFSKSGGLVLAVSGGMVLFILGLIFALATLHTRSLWLAIGLHAGCILGQQGLNLIAKYRIKPPDAWMPWIGPNIVHGMVPTGLIPLTTLLVMGALVWWYLACTPRQFVATSPPNAS